MVSIIISNWRRLSSGSQRRDRKSAFPAASAEIPFPGGSHGLMKEALRNIEEQFKDVKLIGPVSVATFMGITDNSMKRDRDFWRFFIEVKSGRKEQLGN
jgi:hypothetical protein